jgi:hypothetical protein
VYEWKKDDRDGDAADPCRAADTQNNLQYE